MYDGQAAIHQHSPKFQLRTASVQMWHASSDGPQKALQSGAGALAALEISVVQSSAADKQFCALTDGLGGAGDCVAYGLVRAEDLVVVAALQPSMHPSTPAAVPTMRCWQAMLQPSGQRWQRWNLEGLVAKEMDGVEVFSQEL